MVESGQKCGMGTGNIAGADFTDRILRRTDMVLLLEDLSFALNGNEGVLY